MKFLHKLCGMITNHSLMKYEAESTVVSPTEYHYRCLICRRRFWNYKPPKKRR